MYKKELTFSELLDEKSLNAVMEVKRRLPNTSRKMEVFNGICRENGITDRLIQRVVFALFFSQLNGQLYDEHRDSTGHYSEEMAEEMEES